MKKTSSLFLRFIPLLLIFALTACAGAADSSSLSASSAVSDIVSSSPLSSSSDTSSLISSDPSSEASSSEAVSSKEVSSKETSSAPKDPYKDTNIIIMSDVHLCHLSWYGVDSPTRMGHMIDDLNDYYKTEKYSSVFLLGDLSLDHWQHNGGGSWINSKTSNSQNLIKNYLTKLDCKDYKLLPGNHEQYSDAKWKEITGFDRQYYVYMGGYLFIMLDNFRGELDPNYHHDGKYTQTDVEFVKKTMALYPDAPVVLCAHWFDVNAESTEFKNLVKNEERILCMFVGHDHQTITDTLGADWGNKKMIHNGNFSYTKNNISDPQNKWGWRRVRLTKKGIDIAYYTPANTYNINNGWVTNPTGEFDKHFIENPLAK